MRRSVLPTETEWLYAAQKGGELPDASTTAESTSFHNQHMGGASAQTSSTDRASSSSTGIDHPMMPSPVITQKPNLLGVRGMDSWIGEWVQSGLDGTQDAKKSNAAYMVMGGTMAKSVWTPVRCPSPQAIPMSIRQRAQTLEQSLLAEPMTVSCSS
ncbi:SUMF1/EgtB/PvdO family nonheme iron enzyme [Desulforhabdus sp. TSK]|uniref:SUMF1/EgtB/PvdO family nonheme iron enzyme n=1 Tax=Desulforhabdus sp. TSK TaxID=2925014 RepID=UPI0034D660C4